MGLKCFSSFWNNLNSFCKPHQASVVGENSLGTPTRSWQDIGQHLSVNFLELMDWSPSEKLHWGMNIASQWVLEHFPVEAISRSSKLFLGCYFFILQALLLFLYNRLNNTLWSISTEAWCGLQKLFKLFQKLEKHFKPIFLLLPDFF